MHCALAVRGCGGAASLRPYAFNMGEIFWL